MEKKVSNRNSNKLIASMFLAALLVVNNYLLQNSVYFIDFLTPFEDTEIECLDEPENPEIVFQEIIKKFIPGKSFITFEELNLQNKFRCFEHILNLKVKTHQLIYSSNCIFIEHQNLNHKILKSSRFSHLSSEDNNS